jgi:protein-S-isoprenylcysteine O-methyltransferase Ste14
MILLVQFPIPVFWSFVHPFSRLWRGRARFAYLLVGIPVWVLCAALFLRFRAALVQPQGVAPWRVLAGLVLIGLDLWLIRAVESNLGWRRLVGLGELSPLPSESSAGATRELSDKGVYGHMRHPRYAGMILSLTGVWLLVGSPVLAAVLVFWLALVLAIVHLEERELRQRFGPAFEDYAGRVPRFLPRTITVRGLPRRMWPCSR